MLPSVLVIGAAATFGLSEPTSPTLFIEAAREAREAHRGPLLGGRSPHDDDAVGRRPDPILLGAVTTRVAPAHLRDPIPVLRGYLQTELAGLDWTKRQIKGQYTLLASLVRLETSATKNSLVASCAITASVQDAKHGLLLVIEGKAAAEDAKSAGERAENDALAAAVHSSLASLPDALARAQ